MLVQAYAQALIELGENVDSDRFLAVLKAKGHYALLSSIVRAYQKLEKKKKEVERGVLTVSKESDVAVLKQDIEAAAGRLEAKLPNVRIVEDASVVGGFVLSRGENEIDASYKTQLTSLYRKLMSVTV